jgi:hypothetical protein
MLKRSMRPRIKSLTRGWVTPRSSAASACFKPRARITFCRFTISSARTLRYSASSAEKPRSRKTFPRDRVSFTLFTEHLSLPARSLVDQRAQPLPGEIEVGLRRPARVLLKGVQDVDCLGELGDVEQPMFSRVRMRISCTPDPTLDIGFQSFGSSPRCTRQSWNPAIFRTSSGKPVIVSRESPSQITGYSLIAQHTRTWMPPSNLMADRITPACSDGLRPRLIPTFGADAQRSAWSSRDKAWYHPAWSPPPRQRR